jgi:hypothetical protein
MKKFEYDVRWVDSHKVQKVLNEMGANGWELVAVSNSDCYFKREIAQQVLNETA